MKKSTPAFSTPLLLALSSIGISISLFFDGAIGVIASILALLCSVSALVMALKRNKYAG